MAPRCVLMPPVARIIAASASRPSAPSRSRSATPGRAARMPAAAISAKAGCSARVNALLAIMQRLDDTCVLARAGREGLALMQDGACQVLPAGGIGTLAGRRLLHRLEAGMLACNASPGGAADLLAATFFLDRLPLATQPATGPVQGDK